MEFLITLFGAAFLILFIIAYSSLAWGFVANKMYIWFILSIFPDLPKLSILYFIGISLFLNCIIRSSSTHIKKEYKDESDMWFSFVLNPWIALFAAWIIHLFY